MPLEGHGSIGVVVVLLNYKVMFENFKVDDLGIEGATKHKIAF